ncbi:MAG TPA: hypothetical protein VJ464_16830 [Blastocatellia bacterium]|nr:hypothetical protein [Blastocatellia bacterium]
MAAAAPAIGLGSSLIGGLLGRKAPTSTSTSSGTSTPVFSDGQQSLQNVLEKFLRKGIKQGGEPTQAERNTAGLSVNNNFDAMMKRLQANAVARGFNDSGKLNLNTQGLEVQRANAMQQSEAQLQEQARQRQLQLLALAAGPAFAAPGTTYNQTSTGTGPTPNLGQIIGSAGGDLSGFLMLQRMLQQVRGNGISPGFLKLPGQGGVPDPNANPYGDLGN